MVIKQVVPGVMMTFGDVNRIAIAPRLAGIGLARSHSTLPCGSTGFRGDVQ
jgi:hypothetical protein